MTPATDHDFCYAVGRDVLVLRKQYDPDQLWFDFIKAVFPTRDLRPVEKAKRQSQQALQWRLPEEGVPQINLPFATAKKVTKGHRKRLSAAKWPTFQRTPSGGLLVLDVSRDHDHSHALLNKVTEWCNSNLRGMFVPNKQFIFELEDDYVLALLGSSFFRKPVEKLKKAA